MFVIVELFKQNTKISPKVILLVLELRFQVDDLMPLTFRLDLFIILISISKPFGYSIISHF